MNKILDILTIKEKETGTINNGKKKTNLLLFSDYFLIS